MATFAPLVDGSDDAEVSLRFEGQGGSKRKMKFGFEG